MSREMEMMIFRVVLSMVLPAASPVLAVEVEMHGFVQGNYTARITGEDPPGSEGGDFVLGEERARLELISKGRQAGMALKMDFFHDSVADEGDLEFREGFVDYIADRYDSRLGRQIVTWGVGDLLFINDVFPKDWSAFFSGRPVEYLKVGVDGLKLNGYGDLINAEVVIIPFFEPDRLPQSERFFLFDPFGSMTTRTKTEPRADLENTELALRLYRYLGNWDAALYTYKGFWRTPAMRLTSPSEAELFFPKLAVYGASAQGGILGGVVSLEAGYYDSLDDRAGTDPAVPNSMAKSLVGYQRQLRADFTAAVQYYAEWMTDDSAYIESVPTGFPEQDELRHLITVRLTQMFFYQTLRLSAFGFYSPSDRDYYLIPEVRYSFSDALWGAVGANVFGGSKETTFFGQLDKNDNVFVTARYEF